MHVVEDGVRCERERAKAHFALDLDSVLPEGEGLRAEGREAHHDELAAVLLHDRLEASAALRVAGADHLAPQELARDLGGRDEEGGRTLRGRRYRSRRGHRRRMGAADQREPQDDDAEASQRRPHP